MRIYTPLRLSIADGMRAEKFPTSFRTSNVIWTPSMLIYPTRSLICCSQFCSTDFRWVYSCFPVTPGYHLSLTNCFLTVQSTSVLRRCYIFEVQKSLFGFRNHWLISELSDWFKKSLIDFRNHWLVSEIVDSFQKSLIDFRWFSLDTYVGVQCEIIVYFNSTSPYYVCGVGNEAVVVWGMLSSVGNLS